MIVLCTVEGLGTAVPVKVMLVPARVPDTVTLFDWVASMAVTLAPCPAHPAGILPNVRKLLAFTEV
jgi:hypothetical protein